MSLNFFNSKPAMPDLTRLSAIRTMQVWMWSRPFLPKDLRRALEALIPEVREKPHDDARQEEYPE